MNFSYSKLSLSFDPEILGLNLFSLPFFCSIFFLFSFFFPKVSFRFYFLAGPNSSPLSLDEPRCLGLALVKKKACTKPKRSSPACRRPPVSLFAAPPCPAPLPLRALAHDPCSHAPDALCLAQCRRRRPRARQARHPALLVRSPRLSPSRSAAARLVVRPRPWRPLCSRAPCPCKHGLVKPIKQIAAAPMRHLYLLHPPSVASSLPEDPLLPVADAGWGTRGAKTIEILICMKI